MTFQSELFQDDIYPPTAGTVPSLTAEEWAKGLNKAPILFSMKVGVPSELDKPTCFSKRF